MTLRARLRDVVNRFALVAWFAVLVALSAVMLGRHLLPVPTGHRAEIDGSELARFRTPGDESRALVVHVLYGSCGCSERVARHLAASTRPTNVTEIVLVAGGDEGFERPLAARGFRIERTTEAELERLHLAAAPAFVIVDPHARVLWSGGYTDRKRALVMRDESIIARVAQGEDVPELPVYGCAVSDRLRRRLDPTGVL